MEEQFVPYKLALELKDLGFDNEICFGWWTYSYQDCGYLNVTEKFAKQIQDDLNRQCLAPLWQQAFQWFIDKYKLYGETPMYVTEDGLYAHKVVIKDTLDFDLYVRYDEGKFPTTYKANIKCLEELIKIVKQ